MFGDNLGLVLAAYAALFFFFLYNALMIWLEGRGYYKGYTAILVAGSCLRHVQARRASQELQQEELP